MLILPAINEKTFEETKARFRTAVNLVKDFPEAERWVHIDVTNGTFTTNSFWNDVGQLPELKKIADKEKVKIEIHLMVAKPEWVLGDWFQAGADRIIIHHEAMEFQDNAIMLGGAVVLGIIPETPAEKLVTCAKYAKQVLLLAVCPGLSGQPFDDKIIGKIKVLRGALPNVTIEIDGGVNKETGRRLKEAGAQILVSSSFIWKNNNPVAAFQALRSL